eukprot:10948172-Alexandrium_andersonii.AAC.1
MASRGRTMGQPTARGEPARCRGDAACARARVKLGEPINRKAAQARAARRSTPSAARSPLGRLQRSPGLLCAA